MHRKTMMWIGSIKEKLRENSGESIAETLVSMLIAVLAFMMLAGSIVAAARVNAGMENHTMHLKMTDTDPETGFTVTINGTGVHLNPAVTVKTHKDVNASGLLYYYE